MTDTEDTERRGAANSHPYAEGPTRLCAPNSKKAGKGASHEDRSIIQEW